MDDYNATRILNQSKKSNKKKKREGTYISDYDSFLLDKALDTYRETNEVKNKED